MLKLRLQNRFFPDTHKNSDVGTKLKQKRYSIDYKEPICSEGEIPVLALSGYSVLLGWIKDEKFGGWIKKRSVARLSCDTTNPENLIVSLVLNTINIYPNPDALFSRILSRLNTIDNKRKIKHNKNRRQRK